MEVFEHARLSPDTQATLLLCGRFDAAVGARESMARPLSSAEYLRIAKLLRAQDRRPADLVGGDLFSLAEAGIGEDRLRALLGRGMAMALSLERWGRTGLRVLGRGDPDYPARLRKLLRGAAPPLLFVCGPSDLLDAEALCVVGSRDATEDGLETARQLGQACAAERVVVVSGGARGIDRTTMAAALEAGGRSVGILSDSLARAVLAKDNRKAIVEGRLVLASTVDPDARFTVPNAMDRNKYLYALAKAAVVVDADVKGGTWSGAVENARSRWVPAYVRLFGEVRPGNQRLLGLGLLPLPESGPNQTGWIRRILDEPPSPITEAPASPTRSELPSVPSVAICPGTGRTEAGNDGLQPDAAESLFSTFVSGVLAAVKDEPRSEHHLADHFRIERAQARKWLEKATERNLLRKQGQGRKVAYGAPAHLLL